MCGRYYIDDGAFREIEKIARKIDAKIKKERGDIFPSQSAAILTGKEQKLSADEMFWGFPQYNRKGLLINARAETVLEKRTFRDSVLHRRCVIPASRFYEWDSGKNKATFIRPDSPVIYMAGFYNCFQNEERFIILTTQANASVVKVHDRMPLILEENELENWVYDEKYFEFALRKTPAQLKSFQEYEQQSLFE